jgi:hypothetical protein
LQQSRFEGTSGGQYDDNNWWLSSATEQSQKLAMPFRSDLPEPKAVNEQGALPPSEEDEGMPAPPSWQEPLQQRQ